MENPPDYDEMKELFDKEDQVEEYIDPEDEEWTPRPKKKTK